MEVVGLGDVNWLLEDDRFCAVGLVVAGEF